MVQQRIDIHERKDEIEQLVPSAPIAGLLPAVHFYILCILVFNVQSDEVSF